MKRIVCSDWKPKWARWACPAQCPPGIFRVSSTRKSSLFGHLINPLLTKLVRSRWLDIGLVLFFAFFMEQDEVEKSRQKERPILPAHVAIQNQRLIVGQFHLGFEQLGPGLGGQKLINPNPGLKVDQGFNFSFVSVFLLLMFCETVGSLQS